MVILEGPAEKIGKDYGLVFKEKIQKNIDLLVNIDIVKNFMEMPSFRKWINKQEEIIYKNWPWLLLEMENTAKSAGISYEEILRLNLRAWQYNYYGAESLTGCCSSFAIKMEDGTVACAGALDDPAELYCGPIQVIPENGYSFITFPITGTSWGNRGMNSEGLSLGISSQLLPGLVKSEKTINQDLALRIILQTCAKVSEVRAFCNKNPFTMNIVCVDASGDVFCAHNTAAGLFELAKGSVWAMTNHIFDDECICFLKENGVKEFPESPTTRFRRRKILRYLREYDGKCTIKDVLGFVEAWDDSDLGSINNRNTIYITCSNPQQEKNSLWIKQTGLSDGKDVFKKYTVGAAICLEPGLAT